MPDWTYHPVAPIASRVLGERRTRVWALRFLATLVRSFGGRRWIPVVFDHPAVPEQWRGRFGAIVPREVARDAAAVLPVQGATVIRISDDEHDEPGVRYLDDQDVAAAVAALAELGTVVLARPSVLLEAGPAWFNRVIEAATPTVAPQTVRDLPRNPLRWPGWAWGLSAAVILIAAGVGAAAIALGPVLLGYDRDYLGAGVDALREPSPHLVEFLQHDRISMAGNMIGLGILYAGVCHGALRRGRTWAKKALGLSALVALGTQLYFVVTGFVEPLHTAVVVILGPMIAATLALPSPPPSWRYLPDGAERERRAALWAQLILIAAGAGLTVAGCVISVVGLTDVFVHTDLHYLGTSAEALRDANPRLVPFIAHDRAGFGGALIGSGIAVTTVAMWGFRRGEAWVWWTLLCGFVAGTAPAIAIHLSIGYTTFIHLAPVYLLIAATVVAFALCRPYLVSARPPAAPPTPAAPPSRAPRT